MEKFACVQRVDHDQRLIRVVASGRVDREAGREMIKNARTASAEHAYNIFYDMRKAKASISISDLYTLARDQEVMKGAQAREAKVAILASSREFVRYYRFYESTAYNAGLNVRSFVDEKEALEWLTRDMPGAV